MKLIGHRGAKGLAPENTLAALQKGLEHGVDELEIDIRVTKDNVPVLLHNAYLTDPDGKQHIIADYNLRELQNHKADLVTLKDALVTIGNSVPIQIEVKPAEPVDPVIAVVRNCLSDGWRESDFLFGSFSQKTLLELHDKLPNVEKVVIERWSSIRAYYRAKQLGAKRISMAQRWLWWPVVRNFHKAGFQLAAYPVNNPRQGKGWAKHGLYGVITDYPNRFTTDT